MLERLQSSPIETLLNFRQQSIAFGLDRGVQFANPTTADVSDINKYSFAKQPVRH
jgi:hypothetical protein